MIFQGTDSMDVATDKPDPVDAEADADEADEPAAAPDPASGGPPRATKPDPKMRAMEGKMKKRLRRAAKNESFKKRKIEKERAFDEYKGRKRRSVRDIAEDAIGDVSPLTAAIAAGAVGFAAVVAMVIGLKK